MRLAFLNLWHVMLITRVRFRCTFYLKAYYIETGTVPYCSGTLQLDSNQRLSGCQDRREPTKICSDFDDLSHPQCCLRLVASILISSSSAAAQLRKSSSSSAAAPAQLRRRIYIPSDRKYSHTNCPLFHISYAEFPFQLLG